MVQTVLSTPYRLQSGDCHPDLPRASEYHADADFIGSVNYEEAMLLYGLCLGRKPTLAVELGTAQGFSTLHIGQALYDAGHGELVSVDISTDQLIKAKKRLSRARSPLPVSVRQIGAVEYLGSEDRPIDFLFIDTELVDRWHQFEVAWPRLSLHSLTVFHDVSPLHPAKEGSDIMGDLRHNKLPYVYIPTPRGMAIVSKERS